MQLSVAYTSSSKYRNRSNGLRKEDHGIQTNDLETVTVLGWWGGATCMDV